MSSLNEKNLNSKPIRIQAQSDRNLAAKLYAQDLHLDISDKIRAEIEQNPKSFTKDSQNVVSTEKINHKQQIMQSSLQHPQLQNLLYSPPSSPQTNSKLILEENNLTSTKNRRNGGETKSNYNFLKKIGALGVGPLFSAQNHKESDDFTSDSGTFQMQKSEFSQRRIFGRGTVKNFGSSDGGALSSENQYKNKRESKYSNKRQIFVEGYQNSYNIDFEQAYLKTHTDYVKSNDNRDHLNENFRTKTNITHNFQQQKLILNPVSKHVSSFNYYPSTVLSQTKECDIVSNTSGHIKYSMKAIQSSVSAILERAYLQNSNYNGSNGLTSNKQPGIIQYPTLNQMQNYQLSTYFKFNQSPEQTNKKQNGKILSNYDKTEFKDLKQPLIEGMRVDDLFRISLHENQQMNQESSQNNQFNIMSPTLNTIKIRRFNNSNRNTREIIGINEKKLNMINNDRASKTRTEGKYAETVDDGEQSRGSYIKGVKIGSQYILGKSQLKFNQEFEVDNNQLNDGEIKLFSLLQDPDNEEELQSLLDQFPFQSIVNLHNTTGYSALHVATCNNNSNYTQILISHILNSSKELDNDSVQRESENDLFQNALHTDEQDLIDRHLNLSQKARNVVQKWINQLTLGVEEQFAAIHFAAFNGNLKNMQMLEKFGGDIKSANSQGINCMHFAAQGNQPKVLNYLIKQHHFNIEHIDANGCSALHWACVSGSYQAVRYLLAEGANPNLQQLEEKLTPLHMTLKYLDESKEIRTIHKLLIYGAFIDLKDNHNRTPTDYVELIEDEELREQCVTLINDVAYKSNGLFPCFKRCRRINRSLKVQRHRKYFLMLLSGFVIQLLMWLFYINPVIEIFDGQVFTEIFIQAIQGSFNFIIISLLIYLWKSDPGFIYLQGQKNTPIKDPSTIISYDKIIENIDFKQICPECKIIMTKRSRHCYSCKQCVERFDHHCDWIDNCVGIKNHSIFMNFIVILLLYMIFTICLAVDQIIFKFGQGDEVHQNFFAIFPKEAYYIGVAQFFIAVMGLLSLIFLIPLGSLVILQTRNICQNTTTYERFTKSVHKSTESTQSTTVAYQNPTAITENLQINDNHDRNEDKQNQFLLMQDTNEDKLKETNQQNDMESSSGADQLGYLKDEDRMQNGRMTEDSDEIEAIKNKNEYELLKSRSQNKSSDKRHQSSNEFKQVMPFKRSEINISRNQNQTHQQSSLGQNTAQIIHNNQFDKQFESDTMFQEATTRIIIVNGKTSMTSLNRPSQQMEFQDGSESLLDNENNSPVNDLKQEEEFQTDQGTDVQKIRKQNDLDLINHQNHQLHLQSSRKDTISTDQRQNKIRRKYRFLANCRVMCCQTEIKSQFELYNDLIKRQLKKRNESNYLL